MTKRYSKNGSLVGSNRTRLSYRIFGGGKTTLVCFNGVGVTKWVWEPLEEYFGTKYRIITWDYPGHGLSDTPTDIAKTSFDNLIDDSINLIETLQIKKAVLVGHSTGLQLALEVYRRRPRLVQAVISCLGTPGKALATFLDSRVGHIIFDISYILNAFLPDASHWINSTLLKNPVTYQVGAMLKLVNPAIYGEKRIKRYLDNLSEMDFALFNSLMASAAAQTAEDVIAKIRVPILLIASEYDRFVPPEIAKRMQKKTKRAELFIIRNGTHAALLEQPDIFNLKIEQFLGGL